MSTVPGWRPTQIAVGFRRCSSIAKFLLAALFHFQLNSPLWPDAQPYDTIFFAVVALLLVWIYRGTMFDHAGSVTDVIPSDTGVQP